MADGHPSQRPHILAHRVCNSLGLLLVAGCGSAGLATGKDASPGEDDLGACLPECTGRDRGNDGCGGSCGEGRVCR